VAWAFAYISGSCGVILEDSDKNSRFRKFLSLDLSYSTTLLLQRMNDKPDPPLIVLLSYPITPITGLLLPNGTKLACRPVLWSVVRYTAPSFEALPSTTPN